MSREFRSFAEDIRVETRADGTEELTGYAAVFDSKSVEMGWLQRFTESIKPGAFGRSLRENPDVKALLDHDTGQIIARTLNGSLTLSEDSRGLKVSIVPVQTEDGKKAVEWVRSGLVDAMSFGFETVSDRWMVRDGLDHRELLDVNLYEVSLVAFPAYPATSIGVRSAEASFEAYAKTRQEKRRGYARRLKLLSLGA